ncbi:UNVERIFIED_CONTAM: hypothetical protein RMT77_004962 [Armadillidium vulgare]
MKFYKFEFVLILYLFFFLFKSIQSRTSLKCYAGSKCIPINQCQQIKKLLKSGAQRDVVKVRNSICGFAWRRPLVCCSSSTYLRNLVISEPKKNLLPENCGRPRVRNKIFGGTPTPIGAYPWVVALGYRVPNKASYMYDCSGSIINEKYILTAAHCVHQKYTGRRRLSVIQLGTWNLDSDEDCIEDRSSRQRRCFSHIVSGFEDIIIHPNFDKEAEFADDIALIRLNITLSFDRDDNVLIKPVCLPQSDLRVRDYGRGRKAIGAGWGLTEHKNYSSVLMSVELPIVNNKHCVRRYKRQFVGNQLCAGGERGKDTCIGDSGGPLVLSDPFGPPFTQVGIVSFGQTPCGGKSTPSVYTSVARYRKWIENNLKP